MQREKERNPNIKYADSDPDPDPTYPPIPSLRFSLGHVPTAAAPTASMQNGFTNASAGMQVFAREARNLGTSGILTPFQDQQFAYECQFVRQGEFLDTQSNPVIVMIRHGQTEYNKLGLFTGWDDAPLATEGVEEARHAGRVLRHHGVEFDIVYTSWLSRAIETAWLVQEELDSTWVCYFGLVDFSYANNLATRRTFAYFRFLLLCNT